MELKKIKPLALPTVESPAPEESCDGSEPLRNAKHEKFAGLLVAGNSPTEAYRLTFKTTNDNTVWSNGSNLSRNQLVVNRVRWLQGQVADRTIMELGERRRYLARIVRTPIGEVDEDSDLCENYTKTTSTGADGKFTETVKIVMPGKIEAIKMDSQLAGDLKEKPEEGGALQVNLQMIIGAVNQFIAGKSPQPKAIDV